MSVTVRRKTFPVATAFVLYKGYAPVVQNIYDLSVFSSNALTPKLEAANLSLAETLVEAVVWA
jgi:hypothetical protein